MGSLLITTWPRKSARTTSFTKLLGLRRGRLQQRDLDRRTTARRDSIRRAHRRRSYGFALIRARSDRRYLVLTVLAQSLCWIGVRSVIPYRCDAGLRPGPRRLRSQPQASIADDQPLPPMERSAAGSFPRTPVSRHWKLEIDEVLDLAAGSRHRVEDKPGQQRKRRDHDESGCEDRGRDSRYQTTVEEGNQ